MANDEQTDIPQCSRSIQPAIQKSQAGVLVCLSFIDSLQYRAAHGQTDLLFARRSGRGCPGLSLRELTCQNRENEYTKYGFADLIARRGVDVVQPDGRRAGGVSEWAGSLILCASNRLDFDWFR